MLKRLFDFIKENLSVIAVIPLMLGGLWQVLSLAIISPSYIRFFSVSQQVADGLIILCVLTFLYGVYNQIKTLYEKRDPYEWAKRSYLNLAFRLIFLMLFCFIISMATYSLIKIYNFNNTDFYDLIKIVFSIAIILGITYKIIILLIAFAVKILKSEKAETRVLTKEEEKHFARYDFILMPVIFFLATCVFIFITIYFIEILHSFHRSMSIPANLKNKDYIVNKYRLQNPLSNKDSLQIVYWNDKYIFIKDSSKIEVVKFDYMFTE